MEKIVSILLAIKNKYDNCEIFLFGSRVWGNPRHDSDLDIVSHSVNPIRLKNNPVLLNEDTISQIYKEIVKFV